MSAPATLFCLNVSRQLVAAGGRPANVAVTAGVASAAFHLDAARMDQTLGRLARLILEGDYPRQPIEKGFTLVTLPQARFVVAEAVGEDGEAAFTLLGTMEFALARASSSGPTIAFDILERDTPPGWLQ